MSLPETTMDPQPQPPERTEHALILATRPFIGEDRAASWRHTLVAFSLLAATIAAIMLADATWARALLSVFAGLLVVRCFDLFHDYMHGAASGPTRPRRCTRRPLIEMGPVAFRSMLARERRKTLARGFIRILGLVVLCLAARPGFALDPLPLPAGGAHRQWDGPQFVAADRSGHVSLLRARTLQVYPVEKTGALGEPERLQATLEVSGEVQNAALDASGSQWLIQTFGAVHLFADGKEKSLPRLAWLPNSVGFRRDEPVVAVLPVVVGARQGKLGDTPPWLLRPSGEQWQILREMKGLTAGQAAEGLKTGKMNDYVAKWGAWLAGDRSGRLWVGRSYAYRVERFSPGGRQLVALTVAGGVREPDKSSPQKITVKAGGRDATAPGKDAEEKRSYFGFTAEPTILALTEAPDGKIYLLARNKDGACVLDRLDPMLNQLERVSLSIQLKGRATIAVGKDALYVVAYNGHEGRWRIPWLSMEQTVWKKLKITQEAQEEGPAED